MHIDSAAAAIALAMTWASMKSCRCRRRRRRWNQIVGHIDSFCINILHSSMCTVTHTYIFIWYINTYIFCSIYEYMLPYSAVAVKCLTCLSVADLFSIEATAIYFILHFFRHPAAILAWHPFRPTRHSALSLFFRIAKSTASTSLTRPSAM